MSHEIRYTRPRASTRYLALLLGCFALLAACGSPVSTDGPRITRLELSHEAFELSMGQTRTVVAHAFDADGKEVPASRVFWSTQDATVATVSQQGLVTAVSLGATKIAASAGGVSAVVNVTVTARPVARIIVTPSATEVVARSTVALSAEAVDALGVVVEGRTFTWLTSDPAIATVSEQGIVSGVSPGSATIHAVSAGTEGSAVVTVLPTPVASIDLQPQSVQVDVGGTIQLDATLLDSSGTPLDGRALTWTSNRPDVATVSQSGVVSGVAMGSATISVSSPGEGPGGSTPQGSASVTVLLPAVSRVAISPGPASIPVGGAVNFAVSLFGSGDTPLTTTHRTITWSSSDPSVASINANTGRATGVSLGTTTITATVVTPGRPGSRSGTATLTVTPLPVTNVTVSPSVATIHVGAAYARDFTAVPRSSGGAALPGRTVTWSSADPAVAAVDPATGRVTGLVPGTVRINATSEGVTGWADVTVDLVPVSSVVVTPGAPSVAATQTIQLQAQPRDSSGAAITGSALGGRTATWGTDTPGVATVDGTGLVAGVAAGTALVTATIDGTPGSVTVTVTGPAPVAAVTISPAGPVSLAPLASTGLTAAVTDQSGTPLAARPCVVSSSDPLGLVVSVTPSGNQVTDGSGEIKLTVTAGLPLGQVTITVNCEGVSGSVVVSVP